MRALTAISTLALLVPGTVLAQDAAGEAGAALEAVELPAVDLAEARRDDVKRQLYGQVAHFAVPIEVDVTPFDLDEGGGEWDIDGEDVRWRLRLRSSGALSLSLAFARFRMPEGGRLYVAAADGSERIGPFSVRDNEAHGQLWTPPLLTDDVVLEVRLPVDPFLDENMPYDLDLHLTRVHHGYAGFGQEQPLSGDCERDVACVDMPVWQDAARSVALVSVEGVRFCSGFMVNNTALDGKPLFVTAHHCGVTRENAPSVVVMWNFESPSCRAADDLELAASLRPSEQFQSGAALRASYEPTDVSLLELDDLPAAEWNVHYAGWDRSDALPEGATVIHHPNTDLKRLSVDHDPTKATFYLYDHAAEAGDHLMVETWEVGTTEGGSSGAPLFNENQRVIGQLHGGYADCGEEQADWFGRFAVSWEGGGRRGERLSDWLDPLATETLTLDGLDAADLIDARSETDRPELAAW